MAVNTLAIKPMVKVIAKPRIGPVPNKNRKNAETTVVTCVSIMVRNALSKPDCTLFQVFDRSREGARAQYQRQVVRGFLAEIAFDEALVVDAAVNDRR